MTTITAAFMSVTLVGCGVRLETAPPQELVPDPNEISRTAMVNDLLITQEVANSVAASDATTKIIKRADTISQDAAAQEDALGGVYLSGINKDTDEAQASPLNTTAAPTPTSGSAEPTESPEYSSPEDLLTQLLSSSNRIRASLDIPEDGELARLYGSIAINQLITAQSFAKTARVSFALPEDFTHTQWTHANAAPNDSTLLSFITNEDATGYALEVIAAMSDTDEQAPIQKMAADHRRQAEFLAQLAEVSGTAQDPRKVAYELPFTLAADQPRASKKERTALARELELTLAKDYLGYIPQAAPIARADLLNLATSRTFYAQFWGEKFELFPLIDGTPTIQVPTQTPEQ
ncbi:DUF4439 domain-containing protein [Timonella sp. A28]|uniref:DUF4439 domain-containing protein n=1 Tax=Timonella sp. A28 TaxID=3442640 RepID=UPI003EBFE7A4